MMFMAYPLFALSTTVATVTPTGQGGTYNTINDALTGLANKDLTAQDIIYEIRVSGDWTGVIDSEEADTSAYTTDSTRYIWIHTMGDARHIGKVTAKCYQRNVALYTDVEDYIIDGLVWKLDSSFSGAAYQGKCNVGILRNNIFYGSGLTAGSCIAMNLYGGTFKVYNNLFYDISTGDSIAIYARNGIDTYYVYNNTVVNCTYGIGSDYNRGTYYNNICQDNASTDYYNVGGSTHDKNIASDTSSPDDTFDSKTVKFLNKLGKDFHLASDDIEAMNKGRDCSSEFTMDIDGETRTGTWDIGCDQIVETGPGTSSYGYPVILMLE